METIVAVMLLLGCDHSAMVCRQSNDVSPHYASLEECEQDINVRIRMTQNHPVTIAQCVAAGAVAPDQDVVIDWQLDRVGNLTAQARVRDGGTVVAAVF